MRILSKSKLLAYRQCPKRLWLEIHRPELREDSAATQASFSVGHEVGDIAQQLYDPSQKGEVIDITESGVQAAIEHTQRLLNSRNPIFEAGFTHGGALAFADVLLPDEKRKGAWRMIEVKSSTCVKDYHRDDVAIQSFIARKSGLKLSQISLAHIDSNWTYPGGENYSGLLKENDLTEEARARESEVQEWIDQAQATAKMRTEPKINVGAHCDSPFPCGFYAYCTRDQKVAEYPVSWLPRVQSKALKEHIATLETPDIRDIPDRLLNDIQIRVKAHTLGGTTYFDAKQASTMLKPHKLPAYFIDFETIQFPVPIWKGTRPYQQLPFQFSIHRLSKSGKIKHEAFLDITGNDPRKGFASALIEGCGEQGPVFVYNAAFEKGRISELAEQFPKFKKALLAINERVVDLLPIARAHYYHPSQQGSWSIKKVLPAIAPELRYDELEGVQDGGMAMDAFLEALDKDTSELRKAEIDQQLREYCALDTFAMIKIWQFFTNNRSMSNA